MVRSGAGAEIPIFRIDSRSARFGRTSIGRRLQKAESDPRRHLEIARAELYRHKRIHQNAIAFLNEPIDSRWQLPTGTLRNALH
jgi:hypothetical protein